MYLIFIGNEIRFDLFQKNKRQHPSAPQPPPVQHWLIMLICTMPTSRSASYLIVHNSVHVATGRLCIFMVCYVRLFSADKFWPATLPRKYVSRLVWLTFWSFRSSFHMHHEVIEITDFGGWHTSLVPLQEDVRYWSGHRSEDVGLRSLILVTFGLNPKHTIYLSEHSGHT